MISSDIRSLFLEFFANNDHTIKPSSSLTLENDPTIMFANAGMNQFKDYFCGRVVPDCNKATTCQKCLRAGGKHNDLDNVGYTARHHTFFEMLGNFSFGDYFKEQAIYYAWDFLINHLEINADRLLVTIHSSDQETRSIWKKISGFNDAKIITIDNNDNFWSMGDIGPCGPCSEIFYDYGDKVQGGPPGSADQDGDRFVEIWNLVFMQYEQNQSGEMHKLARQSIDTGMGLERISSVMQGVTSNYNTDIFKGIKTEICNILGDKNDKYDAHYNVIADHIRACVFMIVDGIIPSNELRGYVLRRIIRRAIRHGYTLGMKDPFMYKLVDIVIEKMSYYKELSGLRDYIKSTIHTEEQVFLNTIENGMHILSKEISLLGSENMLSPGIAYKLYDTYGFPIDLTQDILKEHNKSVDIEEFYRISQENKSKTKTKWTGTGDKIIDTAWHTIKLGLDHNKDVNIFISDCNIINAKILYIINECGQIIEHAHAESNVFVVTDKTNLYPEGGGQVGDAGQILSACHSIFGSVNNTKYINGIIAHEVYVKSNISVGDNVCIHLDVKRRLRTSRNHSATHILHKALQEIYGPQVMQKGSLCSDKILRFDFSCSDKINGDDIKKIEDMVCAIIDQSISVDIYQATLDDARSQGVTALFGEKYGDIVRVVRIGDFSSELCGGMHVKNTSQIGGFKIISSSSVGSAIKRIEAVTGDNIVRHYEEQYAQITSVCVDKDAKIKQLKNNLQQIKANVDSFAIKQNGALRYVVLDRADQKTILSIVDKHKRYEGPICLLIFNQIDNNICSVCCYTKSIHLNAMNIVEHVMMRMKLTLKYGGRDDMVQFGKLPCSLINSFIQIVQDILQ